MSKREKPKMFIVRKYVKANSISGALRKEKSISPHDVYVDESWKEHHIADAIGFHDTTYDQVDFDED